MLAPTTDRRPRDFAGDKAATLEDFFASMAKALAVGDAQKQAETLRTCHLIRAQLSARNVFDIGSLIKMSRNNLLTALAMAGKNLDFWVETLEDILDMAFVAPVAIGPSSDTPASAAFATKPTSITSRVSTYTEKGEASLGARLMSTGELGDVKFQSAMFTQITTANPKLEVITEHELQHILDTVFEYTFCKFGKVNVDIIYRKHVGTQLRLCFPNLPDRGKGARKVLGKDRCFTDMIKWRFSNHRKTVKDGVAAYKSGFVMDRINICPDGLALIDTMHFPVNVSDEGKLEEKFIIVDTGPDPTLKDYPDAMPHFGHQPYESEHGEDWLTFAPRSKAIPKPEYFANLPPFLPTVQATPFFEDKAPQAYALEFNRMEMIRALNSGPTPPITTAATACSAHHSPAAGQDEHSASIEPEVIAVCSQKRKVAASMESDKENGSGNSQPTAKVKRQPKAKVKHTEPVSATPHTTIPPPSRDLLSHLLSDSLTFLLPLLLSACCCLFFCLLAAASSSVCLLLPLLLSAWLVRACSLSSQVQGFMDATFAKPLGLIIKPF